MQFFLFLNDLAGRWPLLDEVARWIYIGALPALGTLVLAQLLVLPRAHAARSRSQIALALALALALGLFLTWAIEAAAAAWQLGNLSPRPWMTRRVNWLVVEPQDNSFPCVEVLLAAILAVASWQLNRKIGLLSAFLLASLALARMFCGNNYFADVAVGLALGAGALLGCSALICKAKTRDLPVGEFASGAVLLGGTLASLLVFALGTPRFSSKIGFSIGASSAVAAPPPLHDHTASSRPASATVGEGEGLIPEGESAEELALAKRSSLFLPSVETFLTGKLAPLARPFALLDVEVAPVKAGTSSYRCAAIRFRVEDGLTNVRRQTANCAARLVRAAFALDSQLENVDIIAVVPDRNRNVDRSMLRFPGDEVPVFTASIERKNLIVSGPAWANAPGLDGGLWLRARSRLWVNAQILPDTPAPAPPQLNPTQGVAPTPKPTSPQPNRTQEALSAPTIAPPRPNPTQASSPATTPTPSQLNPTEGVPTPTTAPPRKAAPPQLNPTQGAPLVPKTTSTARAVSRPTPTGATP